MIHVRNPLKATAFSVFAGEELVPGMVVKFAQNAQGLEPLVVRAVEADMDDDTVIKGVVNFVPDDSLAVDYILDPTQSSLTLNTGADGMNTIPLDAQCVIWVNRPVIGFDEHSVDVLLDLDTAREGDKVAFNSATALLAPLVDTGTDPNRDVFVGTIYRNEGPEITVILHAI
jgi:hypothetical protein